MPKLVGSSPGNPTNENAAALDGVDTVLLDAGGVLLDLDYAYLRRLLDARGIEVMEASLARAEALARMEIQRQVSKGGRTGDAWKDYFHVLLGRVNVRADLHAEIIESLWEAHARVGLWTVPVTGAVETVTKLKNAGFTLGVVSNAEGHVARDLESAGFSDLFDAVIDSHVVGVEKPDPEIFRIALRELDRDGGTSVYIGDVPAVDVVGARAAGLRPLLLDRHDLYPEIEVPRLRSIEELPARILRG